MALLPDTAAPKRPGYVEGRRRFSMVLTDESRVVFYPHVRMVDQSGGTPEGFPHVIYKLAPHGYQPSLMIKGLDRLLIGSGGTLRCHVQGVELRPSPRSY